ncbi:MAG TPA: STAS domain-containing protein [Beutenbergiaceae bacterium]|nr:STAS domain-containing protein [Beutenbergiaceae bacterium]
MAVLISPHRVRLVLAGEVDASTEAELSEAVTEVLGLGLPVDIDVRNVTFMDSSAISGIARLSVQLGHRPRLIAPPESVRFLLSVTRVGDDVEIVEDDPGFEQDPSHHATAEPQSEAL